jgi:hypothetical protein
MNAKRKSRKNPTFNTLKPVRLQYNYFAASVIAQQYSSSTSVSLGFDSRKKMAHFKKYFFYTFTFQKVVKF